MDYAHELPAIPLVPLTTTTGTLHGEGVTIPESLLDAISAWHAMKDDEEAYRVGETIARKMEALYGK